MVWSIVWLLAMAGDKPSRAPVVAMVLRSGTAATVQVGKGKPAQPLRDMDLLREGYLLATGKEEVRVVFLESGRSERILPGKTVAVGKTGCSGGKGAVEPLKTQLKPSTQKQLRRFLAGQRAGLGVVRELRLVVGWPMSKSVTLSGRPTFSWAAVPGAVRYEVRVESADKERRLLWKETTKATTLPYSRGKPELKPGQTVRWSVTAGTSDDVKEAVEPSELTVAGKELRQNLAELAPLLESKQPDDWLVAALVYEGEKCYPEALRLYEQVAAKRPRQQRLLEALAYLYAHSFQQEKVASVRKRLEQLEEK